MHAIYEPRGPALEYAPYAANLYSGCSHGCLYCYAPACLRKDKNEFSKSPVPRKDILKAMTKQAPKFANKGKILLCFTCDPYQLVEEKYGITREAIIMLYRANCRVTLLTKNPALAMSRDADMLTNYGIECGTTLCWTKESDRIKWEPGAGTIHDRIEWLKWSRTNELLNWLSLEPVIDPVQAVEVIKTVSDYTDMIKIGKLNHMPEIEKQTNWQTFLEDCLKLLQDKSCGYYIKDDLWKHSNSFIRSNYKKTRNAINPSSISPSSASCVLNNRSNSHKNVISNTLLF